MPKSFGYFTKVISKIFFKIIRQLSLFPRFKLSILDIVNFRVLKLLSMKVQYRERCYYPSLKVYSREKRNFSLKTMQKPLPNLIFTSSAFDVHIFISFGHNLASFTAFVIFSLKGKCTGKK